MHRPFEPDLVDTSVGKWRTFLTFVIEVAPFSRAAFLCEKEEKNLSLSAELRKEAEPLFQRIYEHPFVQGIKNGTLSSEQLIHYVQQDHQYLSTFARIYALALTRSQTREEMAFFHENIGFILYSETHPHRNLCKVAGVDFEELDKDVPLAPSARNYMNHMLVAAQSHTLADLYAAILPCPWTYIDIAERMVKEINPSKEHPFYDWIHFYTTEAITDLNRDLCDRLDQLAAELTPVDRERIKEIFFISCDHEYRFWEMAYTLEQYPFHKRGEKK